MVVVAGMLWAGLSGWTEQGGSDGRFSLANDRQSLGRNLLGYSHRGVVVDARPDVARLQCGGVYHQPKYLGSHSSGCSPAWLVGSQGDLDGDVARLMRLADSRRDSLRFRVAGLRTVAQGLATPVAMGEGEAVGEPILEATQHWDVEWAAPTLAQVRYCESTNIVQPCVIGDSGEVGPFQFMPSTWATTPYAHLDPCNPPTAALAAAWMVSQGRWLEWTCWPR